MNIHQSLRCSAFAIAAFSLGLCARGADMSPSLKHGDKSFIETAAKAGMEEVAVSQAALPHLINADVKEFAQMMITDHTGANQALTGLATTKGVMLSAKQPDTSKWDKKKEKGYDEDYIEKMVKDHDEAVELFTKASKKSEDPDVQAFATKTLPTLLAHQARAKELEKTLK